MPNMGVLQIGIKSRGYREQGCFFLSTYYPGYTPASPDYFPASPGNTSPDPSDDLSKYLLASLAILPFHDDPYMKVMQAYDATSNELPIPLPQAPIAPPTVLPPSPVEQIRHDDEIVLARIRTSTLEILIEDIQGHHRSDMKSLLDKIHKLKGGPPPPDY
ncbi:hypothetical protein Tco_1573704 [Tanacetum coccineum]